jgi:predicted adenylyl cyclase CyaB
MPTNLEIKARINNPNEAYEVARNLPAKFAGILIQTDTYYNTPNGRLKLREVKDGKSELIFYSRDEHSKYRLSDYHAKEISESSDLKLIFEKAFGVRGKVIKKRDLFIYQGIRIHIDKVESLGNFIEFEIPIISSNEEASKAMNFLIQKFSVQESDLVQNSYIDLMVHNDA